MELKGGTTVPDPIFDLPNGSVLRIPPKSTAIVWVDVNTEDLAPGIHKATLRLTPGYSRFEEKTVSLELNVGRADVREIDIAGRIRCGMPMISVLCAIIVSMSVV